MPSQSQEDLYVDSEVRILEDFESEPRRIVQLALILTLIEHRDMKTDDLANVMGCSVKHLRRMLRGLLVPEDYQRWYDRIEKAITVLSVLQDKVPPACCRAGDEYKQYLNPGREEFPGGW